MKFMHNSLINCVLLYLQVLALIVSFLPINITRRLNLRKSIKQSVIHKPQ